jgi:hypothetical protein
MSNAPAHPTLLRRAIGTTALYLVGIPFIVFGMLLMFTIVGRRGRASVYEAADDARSSLEPHAVKLLPLTGKDKGRAAMLATAQG